MRQRESELCAVVERAREQLGIPGIAWGVVVDSELVISDFQGLADVASGAMVTEETVFRIASMTKSFTAAATLLSRDKGLLRLDDPVTSWLPELGDPRLGVRDSRILTIGMLLSMAGGFVSDDPWADRQLTMPVESFLSLVPLSHLEPGARFEYSNYGYGLIGEIVARATGMPLRAFVDEHFLIPLGMTSTTWDCDLVPQEIRAQGHRLEGGRFVEEPSLADGALGAMGGLGTTVRDLAKWVSFHMDAWPQRDDLDDGPLSRASRREMATIHTVNERGGYGYGIRLTNDSRDGLVVGHSGGLPGFGSRMEWRSDLRVGVILLANRTYAPMEALARELFGVLNFASPADGGRVRSLEIERFVDLIAEFYDTGIAQDEMFADTYFLDRDDARRSPDFYALRQEYGKLAAVEETVFSGCLRAKFVLVCERGRLLCEVHLCPVAPPQIQWITAKPCEAS